MSALALGWWLGYAALTVIDYRIAEGFGVGFALGVLVMWALRVGHGNAE